MSDTTPRLGLLKPRGETAMRTDQHNTNMDTLEKQPGAHFMTGAERAAYPSPYDGMYVVETDFGGRFDYYYTGTEWCPFNSLPVSACYHESVYTPSGTANTWIGPIKFNNEISDDWGMYDPATGLWTIKYKGLYEVSARGSIGQSAAEGTLGTRFVKTDQSWAAPGERVIVNNPSHVFTAQCKGHWTFNVGEQLMVQHAFAFAAQNMSGLFLYNSAYVRMITPGWW